MKTRIYRNEQPKIKNENEKGKRNETLKQK